MTPPSNMESLAFLFDLDGTLVDSVYQHVLAWREATQAAGIELPVWRIHRQIGMSGGLMLAALARETGRPVSKEMAERIRRVMQNPLPNRPPLASVAGDARTTRDASQIRCSPCYRDQWAITESAHALKLLGLREGVPVITRDDVRFAKPDPDLFLAAGQRLGVPMSRCIIVGDSVWDMLAARRAFALSVGLLSGGYGQEELERAGAYRVYQDPADLLKHLDEVGVRLGTRT